MINKACIKNNHEYKNQSIKNTFACHAYYHQGNSFILNMPDHIFLFFSKNMQLILKREFKKTLSFDQTLVRLLCVHFRFSIGFCPGSFSPILARIWLGHFVENLPPLMIGPNSSFSAHDVLSITLAFLQQRSCQVVLALVIASLF